MKTLLILGAGTAGTMVANRMSHLLDLDEWQIVVVDRETRHIYQPGLLFIPFGMYTVEEIIKPKRTFIPRHVEFLFADIELIEPDKNRVTLANHAGVLHYDELVIATGSHIHPEETPGLQDGGWHKNVFDFYSLEGAAALSEFLHTWRGGQLVLNVAEMPIKCPVAPLEFLFLADWFFHERGMRDKVELVYATPLSSAFTKPRCADVMSNLLGEKGIHVEPDFNIAEVDNTDQKIVSYDGREVSYDLLVSVPTHMGAEAIGASGMGNELNFVPTDKHTLQAKKWENVWVIGDGGDVPASKAGSVAHFMLETVTQNILHHINGQQPEPTFDGHANCFIESGYGKSFLIDFNYDVEPLPGKYPVPGVGPFSLLEETKVNHLGKMAFRWIYWNVLLKGHELPIGSQMSMAGKHASFN